MDAADFDALVRSWNRVSRRAGLQGLALSMLGIVLAQIDLDETEAKKKNEK